MRNISSRFSSSQCSAHMRPRLAQDVSMESHLDRVAAGGDAQERAGVGAAVGEAAPTTRVTEITRGGFPPWVAVDRAVR